MRALILALLLLVPMTSWATDYRSEDNTHWLPGIHDIITRLESPVCRPGHELLRIMVENGYRMGTTFYLMGRLFTVYTSFDGGVVYAENRDYWSMTEVLKRNCAVMTGNIFARRPMYGKPVVRLEEDD